MEYEAARRLYEEGTTGFGTSISFSILPVNAVYRAERYNNLEIDYVRGNKNTSLPPFPQQKDLRILHQLLWQPEPHLVYVCWKPVVFESSQ